MEKFDTQVQKEHLDDYGHVNHAAYLEIFELARWDYLAKRGFAREWVSENQKGPVVLEANIKYRREVLPEEELHIETELLPHEKPLLMNAHQKMYKSDGKTLAAEIDLLFGMMDLEKRRLIKVEGEFAEKLFRQ